MALVVDGVVVYLAHPRTASHAVTKALGRLWGAHHVGQHHETVAAMSCELTVATVRRPASVILSWSALNKLEPLECARTLGESIVQRKGRLFYHADYCDVLLCYERLQEDFDALCDRLQVDRVELPQANRSEFVLREPDDLDDICQKRWPQDHDLWNDVAISGGLYDRVR